MGLSCGLGISDKCANEGDCVRGICRNFGIICRMDLTEENFSKLQKEKALLEAENAFLKARLQAVLGKVFGRSSEKLSPDQL